MGLFVLSRGWADGKSIAQPKVRHRPGGDIFVIEFPDQDERCVCACVCVCVC